ncbi:MAG TPA: hypothetical protein PK264_18860 [Hyphomicrobiaceae bacterium]|nr:hypothetical protein [Hyphomicrobiaceae bacterium]
MTTTIKRLLSIAAAAGAIWLAGRYAVPLGPTPGAALAGGFVDIGADISDLLVLWEALKRFLDVAAVATNIAKALQTVIGWLRSKSEPPSKPKDPQWT